MRVLGIGIIDQCKHRHADVHSQLDEWLAEAREASWRMFADIEKKYSSVRFVAPNNIIFKIKGNKYRLWVRINYQQQLIVIEKIGTHGEYDHWHIK